MYADDTKVYEKQTESRSLQQDLKIGRMVKEMAHEIQ